MFRDVAKGAKAANTAIGHDGVCGSLARRLEALLTEPKSEYRNRRIKNLQAEIKYHRIPLPAFRALIATRRRLRLARAAIEKLSPHQRAQLAALAVAVGETSELFQFQLPPADPSLDKLRA